MRQCYLPVALPHVSLEAQGEQVDLTRLQHIPDEKGNLRAKCLGGWDPLPLIRFYTATIRLKLALSQALRSNRGVGDFILPTIMSIFKSASKRIIPQTNNSTSSSSSNQEVRPIQCLLTAEKAVLLSLQKLSVDYAKAAEALRAWGLSEDNDLGGILTASTSLFNHFPLALSQYVSHGQTMQRQLEVMAKKGESLDNLKQRRKSAHQKAEDTAHQLNKMNPDNKYYAMHAEALKRLRKDVRKMDEDIRLEETILIDHKQTATKVWMRFKFGGLYECCEKGSIAGKYGKLVTAEFEGLQDINQPGMPRNIQLQNKIESLIVEADRHVNAVGLSVVPSRNNQESSPSATSPTVQEPHLPPIPQNTQPFHSGNGHFPERQDSSFPPSSAYPHTPPSHQQQPSQGPINPSRTSPPSHQFSRVTENAVDDFGAVPSPNNGRGQYGSSESSGQSLGGSVVGGRRRDTSFSESNAGPSRFQDQPPPSHWQQQPTSSQWEKPYQYPVHMRPPIPPEPGYHPQDPSSQGGRNHPISESSYSSGPSQWQTQPVVLRPPVSSDGYPQSGNNPNDNSSYSAGPSHVQSPPRPPVSSDPGYPPSQGGSDLNRNSSYSGGPSHAQNPQRPPVSSEPGYPPSQGGSNPNGNSSYSTGPRDPQRSLTSSEPGYPPSQGGSNPSSNSSYSTGPPHVQNLQQQQRPPVSSESGYSQGGNNPNNNSSYSLGPSHLQSQTSDRFTAPLRPPGPPESGRYPMQDPHSLGGRRPSESSSSRGYPSHDPPPSHWQNHPSDQFSIPPPPPPVLQFPFTQGPIINTSSSDSGGYPSQVAPLDVRNRTGGSPSYSESTNLPWSPTTNRFNGGSESTSVTSEGMTRARGPPNSSSDSGGGYPSQVAPLDVRNRTGGSPSYSESTNSTPWSSTTNRFNGGSESTSVTSEGMTRARENSFNNNNQPMNNNSWGSNRMIQNGDPDDDDSPPAYMLMHPESMGGPDTGLSLH